MAALISGAALFFTGVAARATKSQASAAIEQTELQREQTALQARIHQEATQPYVWVDIRLDEKRGQMLQLALGNSGLTVATDVQVQFDTDVPAADGHYSRWRDAMVERLRTGIQSLPPGRTIEWSLGPSAAIVGEDRSLVTNAMVTAKGPHGPLPTLTYPIDAQDFRESSDNPNGSLYQIKRSVDDLAKVVAKLPKR